LATRRTRSSGEEEKLEIRKRKLEIQKWEFESGNQGFETKGAVKLMKKFKVPTVAPTRAGGDATRQDGYAPFPDEASLRIV
jgi:hypothetical protein